MARGGNRNVNLLIRAKDETTKVVNTITRALDGLAAGADDLKDSADGSSDSLAKIGRALASFNKEFRGQSGPAKLAAEFEKAESAAKGLEAALAASQAEAADLARSQGRLAAETEKLANGAKEAAAALEREGVAAAKLAAEERTLKAEARAAAGELSKQNTALRRNEAAIEGVSVRLAAAVARTNELRDAQSKQDKVSARQRATLASSEKNVERLNGLFREYQLQQAEIAARTAAATAAVERQRAALAGVSASVGAQRAAVAKLVDAERQAALVATEAAQAQDQFEKEVRKVASTVEQQAAALSKGKVELQQFGAALGKADASVRQFAAGVKGTLQSAIDEQNKALAQSKRELREQEAVLTELRRAMAATTEPTKELVRDFARASAGSQVMRREVKLQADALAEMRRELARTGNSYDDVVRAQSAFVATQARTGQGIATARGTTGALDSLEQTRLAAARARAEFAKVDAQARGVGASLSMMGPPTFAQASSIANLRQYQGQMVATAGALAQMDAAMAQAERGTITYAEAVRRVGAANRQMEAALLAARTAGNATRTSLQSVAAGAAAAGAAAQRGSTGLRSFWDSLRAINADGRQALSVMERIRGQALSLAAAYGGIFGAIEGFRGIITAYKAVEAAQSRLNVAYDGDQTKVARDLDYLRRTSDRLGLSFTVLSNNYGKFAAATQGTNLAGAETRRIFTVMSEAARVYKLDQEQVNGAFTALTQIASKGRIQLEELQGQLGDRLPGVLKILADGMGLADDATGSATAKLLEMTKAGQVSSAELSKLADGFASRIDGKLAPALESTTAEIDTFFKNVQNAFLRIANGGFIDGFTRFLSDVNDYLESGEAASFFDRLAAGMEVAFDALALLVRNFDLLVLAVGGLVGYKLSGYVLGIANAFRLWAVQSTAAATAARATAAAGTATTTALTGTAAAAGTTAVALTGTAAAAGTARSATIGLTAALRGLLSATGVGLLVAGGTAAFAYWATSADDATEALSAHRKMVDEVKNAYEGAGGSVDKWKAGLDKFSASQARANLDAQKRILRDVKASVGGGMSLLGNPRAAAYKDAVGSILGGRNTGASAQLKDLEAAKEAMIAGSRTAEEYKKALDDIANNAATPAVREYALAEQEVADAVIAQNKIVAEAEKVLTAKTGTTEEATKAVVELSGAVGDASDKLKIDAALATEKFTTALRALKGFIPGLKEELKFGDEVAEIEALRKTLEGLNLTTAQRAEADTILGQASSAQAIGGDFSKTADAVVRAANGVEAAAILLRKKEGFISTPAWDVNAQRVGFGSDTVTLADGSVQKVVKGMTVSVTDANRDLYRRIGEFQNVVRGQIGATKFEAMNAPQQAALTSIAYNYGSLPKTLVAAIKDGSESGIVSAIQALGSDNEGINRGRRQQEAGLFGRGANPTEDDVEKQIEDQKKLDEKNAQDEAKAEEKRTRFRDEQNQRNAELQAEIAGEGILSREATIQAELADRQAAAKKAGTELSKQDVDLLAKAAGEEYDRAQAKRDQKAASEAQAAVEKRVTDLQAQRAELEKQRDLYEGQGNTDGVTAAETQIAAVNVQLREAITNAEAFWNNLGGDEAASKLSALKTASLELNKTKTEFLSWRDVGEMAATGLTNAFDNFAKAVAEGKDVGQAAREAFLQFASDFLRQIAQMIIKQALLNAISAFMPSSGGIGSLLGIGAGVKHAGGIVSGASSRTRNVSPAVFANAARFHEGGLPGLKPDEVPAILQKGEEVLAKGDARNALNGGGAPANVNVAPANVRVVNTFDAGSFMSEGLASSEGEQAFLNFVRSNSAAFKGALGQ